MDGLECSEINRSELERTLRIDSEFYSKSAIKVSDMENAFWLKLVTLRNTLSLLYGRFLLSMRKMKHLKLLRKWDALEIHMN